MGKIVLKILLLFTLLWGISFAVRSYLDLPFHWGNEGWNVKYEWFKEHSTEYNTLFLGSSHIYRHINPQVFDRQFGKTANVRSFNLGYQATYNPEVYVLFEEMLNDPELDLSSLKLLVMDLTPVEWMRLGNARSVRGKYYTDIPTWWRTVKQVNQSERGSSGGRFDIMSHYTISLFEKEFNVGMYDEYLEHLTTPRRAVTGKEKFMGPQQNGFLPLNRDPAFRFRRQKFLDCQQYLVPMSAVNTQYYYECTVAQEQSAAPAAPALHAAAQRLIDMAADKGIYLLFVVMPRSPYKESAPLEAIFPEGQVINMTDPREYPEFYDLDYVYDRGHLNQKGARVASVKLGRKVNQLMKQNIIPKP